LIETPTGDFNVSLTAQHAAGAGPEPFLLDDWYSEDELIEQLRRKLKKPKSVKGWKRKLWGLRRQRKGPPARPFGREWIYHKAGTREWLREGELKMPRAKSRSA
jgi:hypothetical protein